MTFTESFLTEFDPEMAATRKMLERLPVAKLDWKPHAKSKSLGELATHVAELPRFGLRIKSGEFAAGSEKPPALKSAARVPRPVRRERPGIPRGDRRHVRRRPLARLQRRARRAGLLFLKKRAILRRILLSHSIHHRGQLSVYLRLNDVPLPAIYGPTADEEL